VARRGDRAILNLSDDAPALRVAGALGVTLVANPSRRCSRDMGAAGHSLGLCGDVTVVSTGNLMVGAEGLEPPTFAL
jgi:hypothetical protein